MNVSAYGTRMVVVYFHGIRVHQFAATNDDCPLPPLGDDTGLAAKKVVECNLIVKRR